MDAEAMREDYDWREAWSYGNGAGCAAFQGSSGRPQRCEGAQCSDAPCGVDDIAEVIAASEGENDVRDWLAVAKLNDGRFAYVEAGCDYTGWDCRAGGTVWVSHDLANLWRFGLTQQGRERLGEVPPE